MTRLSIVQSTALTLLVIAAPLGCSNSPHENGQATDTAFDTDYVPPTLQFGGDPSVPQTCDDVRLLADAGQATTVGCEFYAHSLDTIMSSFDFGVVLANVNHREDAHFTVWGSRWDYSTQTGEWDELLTGLIRPLQDRVIQRDIEHILLNDNPELYTHPHNLKPQALMRKGAYKIVTDVPIVAYQFNPLSGSGAYASDASTLMPVSTWSDNYQVIGYKSVEAVDAGYLGSGYIAYNLGYAAIVAAKNNTTITVNPSAYLRPGYNNWEGDQVVVPGGREPFQITLDAADVLYLHADIIGESLSGTKIRSDAEHPIAVFTGHQCALIPKWAQACDNVEEQLPGLQNWGKKFVAGRLPNRNRTNYTDPVLWQLSAALDNTTITFEYDDDVRGLPGGPITLQAGEVVDYYVYGSFVHPGDFIVDADKPIAILQYMTGESTTSDADGNTVNLGDPAMAYVPPTEQFLSRYVVHVPKTWEEDYLIVTRPAGSATFVDGLEADNSLFKRVAGSNWEVARLKVADGNHILESGERSHSLGVIIAGLDENDSYAYYGGTGFALLHNPQ